MQFSVIIPCFNAGLTIENTLSSIKAQRHKDFEIIVIDDGSLDNTSAVVAKFTDVRYVRQDNAGVSAARNLGASIAKGEWLAFCDADDIWASVKLGVLAACIDRLPQYSFFFHDFYLFNSDSVIMRHATQSENSIFPFFAEGGVEMSQILSRCHSLPGRIVDGSSSSLRLYGGNAFKWLIHGNFILPSAVVVRKRAFHQTGGFDQNFRSAEETEFFLRCARAMDFAYIDSDLAGYHISREGLTGNLGSLVTNGMRALLQNVIADRNLYAQNRNAIRQAIGRRYARMAYYWLSVYRRPKAITHSFRAIRYFPWQYSPWLTLAGSLCPLQLLRAVAESKKILFSPKK